MGGLLIGLGFVTVLLGAFLNFDLFVAITSLRPAGASAWSGPVFWVGGFAMMGLGGLNEKLAVLVKEAKGLNSAKKPD
mgnify:FL=1